MYMYTLTKDVIVKLIGYIEIENKLDNYILKYLYIKPQKIST